MSVLRPPDPRLIPSIDGHEIPNVTWWRFTAQVGEVCRLEVELLPDGSWVPPLESAELVIYFRGWSMQARAKLRRCLDEADQMWGDLSVGDHGPEEDT